MTASISAPSWWLALAEPQRAFFEASTLLASVAWLQALPRGDGHPVYLLPGFMAGDSSTYALRRFLQDRGYEPQPWGFGRNLGPRGRLLQALQVRLREISEGADGKRVSLIGWSLGGIYARELARRAPQHVRQVITLGSPFGGGDGAGTNAQVAKLFESLNGQSREMLAKEFMNDALEPPPVPSTAIFSKSDGIASWRVCLEKQSESTDNVEIVASHCGMGFNPAVFYVIADRLAQREGQWRPFDRSGMRGWLFPPPQFAG